MMFKHKMTRTRKKKKKRRRKRSLKKSKKRMRIKVRKRKRIGCSTITFNSKMMTIFSATTTFLLMDKTDLTTSTIKGI